MELPIFQQEEEEWMKVMFMYDSALKEIGTKLEILNNEFKLNHQYNPIEHITSRIKSPQSIAKKMRHIERELTVENIVKYINDVAGIRVICSFTSDIYRIADLIAQQNDVQVLKVKDYITCPKPNGYTSYHMIISVPIYLSNIMVNTKVEIQIRTIAMDFWASLEHKMYYKFEGNAPERIRKELKECAEIVGYLDQKMLKINEEIKSYYQEDELQQYKELISKEFQNRLKESYGSVVDEEFEKVQLHSTIIQTSEHTIISEDALIIEAAEVYRKDEEKKDNPKEDIKTKKSENKRKENDKKSENLYYKIFGMK